MVGQALVRRLAREDCEVLTAPRAAVDLRDRAAVDAWLAAHRPDALFLAAAKVGGILANARAPADFLFDNLLIQANVIDAAWRAGVGKALILGSSCVYPRDAPQPLREGALLTGPLEATNEAYALAKIAGIKLGQACRAQHGFDAISAMPCNLYGPGDHYGEETSHVLAALIRRADAAKVSGAPTITLWGTGAPRREFLHVDDCADALVLLMTRYSEAAPINVGSGQDITIADLARLVCDVVGCSPALTFDPSKPDGTPRKLLDVSRMAALGWRPSIGLREGVADAYADFLDRGA